MEQTKLMKISSVIYKVLNVIEKLLYAGAVIAVLACGYLAMNPSKMQLNKITLGHMELVVGEQVFLNNAQGLIIVSLIYVVFSIVISVVVIKMLKKILQSMKDGRPFEAGISKNIKSIAWLKLAEVLVEYVFSIVAGIEFGRAVDFNMLFNMDVVKSINSNYNLDISFLTTIIVLFLLSYVFAYGENLQKESDETL